jgi:hypothetical protein
MTDGGGEVEQREVSVLDAGDTVPAAPGSGSFYGWLWRRLPGPAPLKVLICVLLVVAVVALLYGVVFPWLEPRLPFGNETVTGGGG